MTTQSRKVIHEKLEKDKATAVWMTNAGFFDCIPGNAPSCWNIEKLTGIKVKDVNLSGAIKTSLTQNGKTVTWECPILMKPVFIAEANHNPNQETVAYKDNGNWKSIFFSCNYIPSEALRLLADKAGVYQYSMSDDYFYLGYGFIGMQVKKTGMKKIQFPKNVDIYEYETQELIADNVKSFSFPAKAGDTKLFSIKNSVGKK